MNSTLQIRIDKKTKDQAKKLFADLGTDTSSAVKLFIGQALHEKAIPFRLHRTKKEFVAEWKAESKELIKNGKRYSSAEEAHRDIIGK